MNACHKHISTLLMRTEAICRTAIRYTSVISRGNGMKLDSPEFHGIFTPGLQTLQEIFKKYNYEIRIAGGAVRDLLKRKVPNDIDFATTATPSEMQKMFSTENIRMINTKGEKHGTITARIKDQNFEVTTLRIDKITDGRHAEVEFTKDWVIDAERRDLTINSMFLGLDGTVYDFFNGREHLDKCDVRFVGDPTQRIQEDYLRILRYFRFFGRISPKPDGHSAHTLQAIRENAEGLAKISGERIWMELQKILVGNHAAHIVRCMYELGLAEFIGLPTNGNLDCLGAVCERSCGLEPKPITILVALLHNDQDVLKIVERMKTSVDERKLAMFIVNNREDKENGSILKSLQDIIVANTGKEKNIVPYVCEIFKYRGEKANLDAIVNWTIPVFPVSGKDLLAAGVPRGKELGKILDRMKMKWTDSNYKLNRDEIMTILPEIRL
ncbi:CCA tRNA nucleotidyltransferase 1, mitochondrial-like [Anneissia japonica]|uniref:CCA tRNA nucleotidyltransferase 1, mitochondrial-like n=1 Tax=Anneissia japonica TaxID=1529436 RepID=UPI001425965E|nr:CCA tRNA nucleotidyltransferase 1, mitochondrial-like [Anneissia japonica]